jgi:hypothetical protein
MEDRSGLHSPGIPERLTSNYDLDIHTPPLRVCYPVLRMKSPAICSRISESVIAESLFEIFGMAPVLVFSVSSIHTV